MPVSCQCTFTVSVPNSIPYFSPVIRDTIFARIFQLFSLNTLSNLEGIDRLLLLKDNVIDIHDKDWVNMTLFHIVYT